MTLQCLDHVQTETTILLRQIDHFLKIRMSLYNTHPIRARGWCNNAVIQLPIDPIFCFIEWKEREKKRERERERANDVASSTMSKIED